MFIWIQFEVVTCEESTISTISDQHLRHGVYSLTISHQLGIEGRDHIYQVGAALIRNMLRTMSAK